MTPSLKLRFIVCALAFVAGACTRSKKAAPAPRAQPAKAEAPGSERAGGVELLRRRTTSGAIAVANLDGQLASEQKLFANDHLVADGARLVDFYGERAQFLGTLEDYDRADAISAQLVREHPGDGEAHLARASALNCVHRFKEALAELEVAQAGGVEPGKVRMLRASTLLAMGHAQEAADLFAAVNARHGTLRSLGDEGMARAELGQAARARGLFQQALQRYRDVSPFPVAWVEFHEAMVEAKLGRADEAMALYGDAVARLPAFAAAQGHLAALEAATGKPEQALARLRALSRSTDPEFLGQQAGLLPAAEAAPVARKAAARFDELLAHHPEAYADHAARFWLGPGADAKKALPLARKNLEVRQTADAYELALEAALAANDVSALCPLAEAADELAASSVPLAVALERAFKACGQPARAQAEAKRLRELAE